MKHCVNRSTVIKIVAAMGEALSNRRDLPNQPDNDLLVWNASVENSMEAQSNDQSTRRTIGSLAISETESDKMSYSQNRRLVNKFLSFYRDFKEMSTPKKKIVSAYCIFLDPTLISPGHLHPPSADRKQSHN